MKTSLTYLASSVLFACLAACSPMRSASEAQVKSLEVTTDPNLVQGTYLVSALHTANKTLKLDANGMFTEQSASGLTSYQMYEVVDDTTVQTIYVSNSSSNVPQDFSEKYQRVGSVLTLTATSGTQRQLAFSPRGDVLTLQAADLSSMEWTRVKPAKLKAVRALSNSELFNLKTIVIDEKGIVIPHPDTDLTVSHAVTCVRQDDGSVILSWQQDPKNSDSDFLKLQLNSIADKNFVTPIAAQDTHKIDLIGVEHRSQSLGKLLNLQSNFSSGAAGTTCSQFELSITQDLHLKLQATCGPLSASGSVLTSGSGSTAGAAPTASSVGYTETVAMDLNCMIQDNVVAPVPATQPVGR